MPTEADAIKNARIKASRYCSFAERSPRQVLDKLLTYGIGASQAQNVLQELVQEQFVDEQRFAKAFANDKFKFNKWGKIKIANELKLKHAISEGVIKTGLAYIDMKEYRELISQLLQKKLASLNTTQHRLVKKKKCFNYMIGRGFETDLVLSAFESLSLDRQ